MRILILGGDGMIGHQVFEYLLPRHDVRATLHRTENDRKDKGKFNGSNTYFGVDVNVDDRWTEIFTDFKPDVVINAVGIVKQSQLAKKSLICIKTNALLPHRLVDICKLFNARLIHLSTDCVFSGRKGNYTESDIADAEDLYGRTKILGEIIDDPNCITLRTSTIGLELGPISDKHGLVEWFLSQKRKISGYHRAIYTGLTTIEFSRVIELVITKHKQLSGLWHVASADPINKYDLLSSLSDKLDRRDVDILINDGFICDRSLSAKAFEKETGYCSPGWDVMLDELAGMIKKRGKYDFRK